MWYKLYIMASLLSLKSRVFYFSPPKLRSNTADKPFYVKLKLWLDQSFAADEDAVYATKEYIPNFPTGEGPSSGSKPVEKIKKSKKSVDFYDNLLSETYKFHAPSSELNED